MHSIVGRCDYHTHYSPSSALKKQVTNTTEMFHNAHAFNQPIGAWDTRKVKPMLLNHALNINRMNGERRSGVRLRRLV